MVKGEHRDPTAERAISTIERTQSMPFKARDFSSEFSAQDKREVEIFLKDIKNQQIVHTLCNLDDLEGHKAKEARREEDLKRAEEFASELDAQEIPEKKTKVNKSKEAKKLQRKKEDARSKIQRLKDGFEPIFEDIRPSPELRELVTPVEDREENLVESKRIESKFEEGEKYRAALENAFIVLQKLETIFLKEDGVEISFMRGSKHDDIKNGVDIIASVSINGNTMYFGVDITTGTSEATLQDKFFKRGEITDWPKKITEEDEDPDMASRFILGFRPANSLEVLKGAGLGVDIDSAEQEIGQSESVVNAYGKLGKQQYRYWVAGEIKMQIGHRILHADRETRDGLIEFYNYLERAEKSAKTEMAGKDPDWGEDAVYQYILRNTPKKTEIVQYLENLEVVK